MQATLDDSFVVFVREKRPTKHGTELIERELASCRTHEEAEWVRKENSSRNRKCVIRFLGPTGGGD